MERELLAERTAAEAEERRAKIAIEEQQLELENIEQQRHREARDPHDPACNIGPACTQALSISLHQWDVTMMGM